MQYRLTDSLGLIDARKCNTDLGASLPLLPAKLAKGQTIDLPDAAAKYLKAKYPALLEDASKIKAVAQEPAIQAPHGSVERATEDLKRYKEKGTVKE